MILAKIRSIISNSNFLFFLVCLKSRINSLSVKRMARVTWLVLTNFSAISLSVRSWTAGWMLFETGGVVLLFSGGALVYWMILIFLSDLPPVFCNFPPVFWTAPRLAKAANGASVFWGCWVGALAGFAPPSAAFGWPLGWFCPPLFFSFLSFFDDSAGASPFCSSASFYFFFNAASSFLRAFSALAASLWAFFSSGVSALPAAFSAFALSFFYWLCPWPSKETFFSSLSFPSPCIVSFL